MTDVPEPKDHAYVQRKWVRLYRPGPLRALVIALATIGCVLLALSGAVVVSASSALGTRTVLAVVTLGVLGLGLWLTSRGMTAGVAVRDAGLRLTTWRTRTEVEWRQVSDIRRITTLQRLAGTPAHREGELVEVVLKNGRAVRSPVAEHGVDFVGRPEAYEIAATALIDWWAQSRP